MSDDADHSARVPDVQKDTETPQPDETILLVDLAPRREVRGGGGTLFFGQQPPDDGDRSPER